MPRKTAAPGAGGTRADAASMRPRPDAAENSPRGQAVPPGPFRFNEAAARCRGKRRVPRRGRPPAAGFNEAAARCRGKHTATLKMEGVTDALQ